MPRNDIMQLVGAGALVSHFDDLKDMHSMSGEGYAVGTHLDYGLTQEYGNSSQSGTPHVRPGIDATRQWMARTAADADNLDDYLMKVSLHLGGEIQRRAPVDTGALRASYMPPVPLD